MNLAETEVNRAVRDLFDLGVRLGASVPLSAGTDGDEGERGRKQDE